MLSFPRILTAWPTLLGMAALMSFQGDPNSFNRLRSGVEYRIYQRENGKYVRRPAQAPTGDATYASRIGKIISLHMEFRTGRDSVLMSSRQQPGGQPARVPLDTIRNAQRGGIEEAVSLLQPGDSAVFRFNADTVFAKSFRQPVPPFIRKAGNTLVVVAKVDKIQTQEAAMQEVQEMMRQAQEKEKQQATQRLVQEDTRIQAYLKQNKLKGVKAPGGVYYVVTKPSTGVKPQAGQTVSVLYKGMLLDGKVFDSSERNGNQPIEFPLGQGRVIPGWDQGIALLNKGSKAVLLIPSSLAYGPRGAGADIPPNAILRFDVELVNVK
ncbi:FKBP-type peptidyl-prolyl cis-trans isomerase [Hymenobacter wooponensis]|uniref:peptidylprolyl isomerase n=1 Tax=Hymenobacter wooponensis TaxID=1525360 RepID=A0A4Z0MUK3_9BACT|nr:FKBP-type peptidyl-prolyl cis-trans isomerase [Hymenobacter wooponensis]TGD83324.1 FKBP-type peptidyl-prolyl cis-trans isomerase [Hymenobacter wooponensis]